MGDFALVTEGITDHQVLRNVLIGFYKEQREPVITADFPDKEAEKHIGGWTLVFQYLRAKKFRQAFQLNAFVVVQVDTDVSEEVGFDVPKQNAGGKLTPEELVTAVIERLKVEIGAADWATYGERFIFAVGVEQIECWILPLWHADANGEQTANCAARLGKIPGLRDELTARNLRWFGSASKQTGSYDFASRDYKKRKKLLEEGPRSPSLRLFLQDLGQRAITLTPEE
jgi:hypothetical protein